MYEDQDLEKAMMLQDKGFFIDLDLFELAKKIYQERIKNE